MKASNNYLALRNTEGDYYINGNWRIDFPNDYEVAGTVAHYERKVNDSILNVLDIFHRIMSKLSRTMADKNVFFLYIFCNALYHLVS